MERTRAEKTDAKTGQLILSQGFNLGALQIRFYSVFLVAAIVSGYVIALYRGKKAGFTNKFLDNVFFWLALNSFIAARIYYVIFYWQSYAGNWHEIYRIWHGGLAIYGAIIGGLLTLWYFSRKNRISPFSLTDIVVFGLPIAQAIGRIGNYLNYEAFGKPTDLLWKMFVPENFRPPGFENFSYFHPTFLYEIIWNICVFASLAIAAKRQPKPGVLTAIFLIGYSLGRFFIESIRLDSAFFGPLRGDQITAVLMILIGLFIIFRRYAAQSH